MTCFHWSFSVPYPFEQFLAFIAGHRCLALSKPSAQEWTPASTQTVLPYILNSSDCEPTYIHLSNLTPSSVHLSLFLPAVLPTHVRQPAQPRPIDTHADPLLEPGGADAAALVEPDAGLVPLQHGPVQAQTPEPQTLARQRLDQRRAEPAAPVLRPHKQILQVDPRRRVPRAVVVEEQRHARDGFAGVGVGAGAGAAVGGRWCGRQEERLCVAGREPRWAGGVREAEGFGEGFFCRQDFVQRVLVLGEFFDHGQDRRHVGLLGIPDSICRCCDFRHAVR